MEEQKNLQEEQPRGETSSSKLGTQPVGKLLLKLSIPTITAQLVNALYNIVDRIYIGHMPDSGSYALTAMGVCLSLIMIISAFAYLTAIGGAARASIMMGKGDKEEAERILGNCAVVTAAVGAILTVIFIIFAEKLLWTFGATEDTIEYAVEYMRIYALGSVFVELALGLNAFITAQGFSLIGMLSVLIGAVTNIVLDPILIYGFSMGVKGAAIATVVSQMFSAIWVVAFLTGKKTVLRIRPKYFKICLASYLPCIFLGLSPFIMQFTESVLTICFNVSLKKYGGTIAVGAMTILSSVMQFAMLPLQGMTQGAQPVVSYNYGAGKKERVKRAFSILLRSCVIYSALLWAICMIFPQLFVMMFTTDEALKAYAIKPLRIYMCMSLIFGAQIACQQTFIALGNAKTSFFLAVLRKIILLIPLIFVLPYIFTADKVTAVFMAEPIADTLAVATTVTIFAVSFSKYLKREDTEDTQENVPVPASEGDAAENEKEEISAHVGGASEKEERNFSEQGEGRQNPFDGI